VKTLQILPALEQGGVERGVVEINRAIIAAGWENVVVSVGGRLVKQIEADGARHITLDVKSKNPLTFFSRASALAKVLEKERPDVVCVHSRVPAWLFVWANRKLGIKWISFAHGANSISRYSRVMTMGDLTVTPSKYLADYLKDAYGIKDEKLRIIPRAIDQSKFDTENLDKDFIEQKKREWNTSGFTVVMALGRITQLKGLDVAIMAMAKLREKLPRQKNFKLVIVGEAELLRKEYENSLKETVCKLGLQDNVVFAGAQSKVAECLSIADIVVSANYKKCEAFGRSMAEALAMDRPVVATAFGGALDIVEDGVNGALVPTMADASLDERAMAFADAIERVSNMKFSSLRKNALEKFSYSLMVKRSLDVYKELATRRS
jgi:glycosyltransferase involved in cell wall biosynthesis